MGENIARLRDARGLSQAAFGDLLRMRQPSVAKLEQGTNPELRTLLKVAKALAASIEDLIVGVDEDYDRSVTRDAKTGTAHPSRTGQPERADAAAQALLSGRVSPTIYESAHLAETRDAIERVAATVTADLTAIAERLPRGQATVARRPPSGDAPRAQSNRRPPHRPSGKKQPHR